MHFDEGLLKSNDGQKEGKQNDVLINRGLASLHDVCQHV